MEYTRNSSLRIASYTNNNFCTIYRKNSPVRSKPFLTCQLSLCLFLESIDFYFRVVNLFPVEVR